MSAVVNGQQLIRRDMCIALSRAERSVTQHFLDGPEIGPRLDHVRCRRVTKHMGRHFSRIYIG